MVRAKHWMVPALFANVLIHQGVGCTRTTSTNEVKVRALSTTIPNAPSIPDGSVSVIPDHPADACEYLRELRSSCDKDAPNLEYVRFETALSLAQCSALSLVLTTGPLEQALQCVRTLKSTATLISDVPSYCFGSPVQECLVRVLEAGSTEIPSAGSECEELASVCGSQPITLRTDMCEVLDAAIAPSFRRNMRACLSWQCSDSACASELLALGRIAQQKPNAFPLTLNNSPCTEKSGFPKVITREALDLYGECPPMYSSIHMFLWYLDAPPASEFVDECAKLVEGCNVRRLKTRRTDVPMNLTQRPCRTALRATKPKFRKELSQCMAVGCNAADCLDALRRRFSK